LSQARRVRRIVRKIEPWTVLKFSVLWYLSLFVILLVAGVALWIVAGITGARGGVESFFGDLLGSKDFHLLGGKLLEGAAIGGVVLVVVGTMANTLMAVLYNLISDVVGGVEVTVLEEDPAPARVTSTGPGL
jgi:hypothetical protein